MALVDFASGGAPPAEPCSLRRRLGLLAGAALACIGSTACSAGEEPTFGEISLEERPEGPPILPREELEYVLRGDRVIEISFECPSWGAAEMVTQTEAEVSFRVETTLDLVGDCIASDCFILDAPLAGRAVINEATGEPITRTPDRFTDCPLPEE